MKNKYLTNLIDYRGQLELQEKRPYIGASAIGGHCERSIWYGYHGYDRLPKTLKQRRTLEIGKTLEAIVIDELRAAGLDIEIPNKDNAFLAVRDKELTYFQGHMDAVWRDKAIIEIKTAKDSSFRIFEKNGLRQWYPIYYAQVQSYMGMSKIDRAFVIALNKDASEYHDEEVNFDERYYQSLCEKAQKIVEAVDSPPLRISNSPLYFACKMCDFRKVCHG